MMEMNEARASVASIMEEKERDAMPTRANEEYVKGFEDSPEMMMKMKTTAAAAAAAAAVNVVPVSNEYAMIALCVFVSPLIVTFARALVVVARVHSSLLLLVLSYIYTYAQVFCVILTTYYQLINWKGAFCLWPVREREKDEIG